MDLEEGLKKINGCLRVEIQGFFTERYINLCKINNIKIWNIQNISGGIVRFSICINDFKKLRCISKKTKCKTKIICKKGIYFRAFKYRKRKLLLVLLVSFVILCILSNSFIWSIDIVGNEYLSTDEIKESLNKSGLYVRKCKIGFKTKDVTSNVRLLQPDISWLGIKFEGTRAIVKVVEKTKLNYNRNNGKIGDIVSDESGVIEKITVESGTAIPSVGDYIEKGRILIEGKEYSRFKDVKDVGACGSVQILKEYEYVNSYDYIIQDKEYIGKTKYSIGLSVNNNEFYINYLDKSLNYDIIKKGSNINIFGNDLSIDLYKFNIYNNINIKRNRDEIISQAEIDAKEYIEKNVIPNCRKCAIKYNELEVLDEDENHINVKVIYYITQEIGYFRERI